MKRAACPSFFILQRLPPVLCPGVDPVYFIQAYSSILLIAKPIDA